MKHRKMFAAIATAATAALVLAGCGSSDDGATDDTGAADAPAADAGDDAADDGAGEGDGEGLYIAMVSKGFQHQFWQAVKQGAEERAAELGVEMTFDGPAAETEVDAQLQMLKTAIDKQPDAIAYAALDPEACVPLYNEAKEAGIPIVQFDAPCNSDYALTLVATDGEAAAAIAADHMAELIGGAGEVAVISHSQINSTGVQRRDGFVNRLAEEYPDIEVVDIQYGDGDHIKSADIAKAMITAHPDLKGLYGTNEGSAIGIVNAVGELGLEPGDLTIIGFDSGAAQINAIKDGTMAGAITQDPISIGALAIQSAYDAIQGKTLETFIDTGGFWYDKSNLDDPKIASVLYE